ncbi:MAG: sensor histidine kinase [Ferruginibacter sp.]|nr:sensor histidine kinase [Ferruginibacter sp.]
MIRKILCFSILLSMYYNGFSQNKEATLLEKIRNTSSDTAKANLYNILANQFAALDSAKTFSYADAAFLISTKKNYNKGKADSYFAKAQYFIAKNKFANAEMFLKDANNLYIKDDNKVAEIECILLNIKMMTSKGNKKECLPILEDAKLKAEKTGDKNILAAVYKYLGSINDDLGNQEISMQYNLKALELYESQQNKNGIVMCYNNLGKISFQNKNYPLAVDYYKKGIVLAGELEDYLNLGKCKLNLANVYTEKQQPDSAVLFLKEADKAFEKINFARGSQTVNNNLGAILLRQKKYKEALPYLEKALSLAVNNNNIAGLAYIQSNIGYANTFLGNFKEAKKWFDEAALTAQKYHDIPTIGEIFKRTSEYDSAMGDFKNAYNHKNEYYKIKDSLLNEKNAKTINELQAKYDSEKKDKQIQEQNFTLARQKIITISIIGLSILLGMLGFSFYRRYKLKQEKKLQTEVIKQQDLATKAILQAEENERERIAKDLHDGVGQLMSAAKMNLSAFESEIFFKDETQKLSFEKVIVLIDEGCKEVRSVSHQMMPNALLKAGLASAIKEFIDKIDNRILKVNLYNEGLNERIDNNVEIVLYRIIQECVNNVIKHSGANQLDISLIKDADGISVSIEDNGKGFNTKDTTKFEGIGLKNIASRIDFLKGTVEFDSAEGRGTMVSINVPVV